MTRPARLLLIVLLILSFPISIQAAPVADIQTRLNRNEALTVITTVSNGEIQTQVTTSQGLLKLIVRQDNTTLLEIDVRPVSEAVNHTVAVTSGEIEIFAASTENYIPSDVSILITQDTEQAGIATSSGLLIGGGVLILLLLPFVYMFGRYQGQSL